MPRFELIPALVAVLFVSALVGVLGYAFVKLECEPAPLILGYVLGPLMEEYLRRAMLLSRGGPTVFVTRPLSPAFVIGTALILAVMIAPAVSRKSQAG